MAKQTLLLFICLLYSACYTTTWSPAPPLPFPMWGSVIGVNHNHTLMYLIGGDTNASYNNDYTINTTYQFDGNLFKPIGTVPFQTGVNPYENVLGISTTVQDITYFFIGQNDIIGFNTTSLKIDWFNISTPIGGDYGMCLVSNDSHLFYLQYNNSNGMEISIFSYDIENKHWLQEYEETQDWEDYSQGACVYYNHGIYMIGGIMLWTPDIWMYDIIQHKLSIVGNMTYSAVNLAVIMPNNNGIMYIIGGEGPNGAAYGAYKYVDVWNANTNQIISSSSLKTARESPMVGFMKERIYVMGGVAGKYPASNVTKLTEMSDIIPTLSPTHSPTKPTYTPTNSPTNSPTHSPTKPTYSPTNSPTISPTNSPTKPTNSPTNRPTKVPTKFVSVSLSEQQFIYYASGIIAFMFLCCIFWRCYQKKKPENNVIVNNNINVIGENIHHVSVDGAAFQNQSEGQLERDVEDTFNN